MHLNGIDISGWQAGIDLSRVPCDFVIVKATQGTGYVNPDFARAYSQAKANGKKLGAYHYAGGGSVQEEAEHFLRTLGNRIGECVLVLDWESEQNAAYGASDRDWCGRWLDYVHARTGVRPLLYISQSIMGWFDGLPYGLWVAQYANYNRTGYQDVPWNEGAYNCIIRQYSSAGALPGYDGNLDLNKYYGDAASWDRMAGMKSKPTIDLQKPGKAVNDAGLHYRAHVASIGWCPSVRDGQTAGTTGQALQLEAFKVSPPEGVVLDVSVHIANVGWKTWKGVQWIKDKSSGEGSNANDPILGTVGKAQGVEAVAIKVAKNPTGKKLKYRVHVSGFGWTGWIDAPYACGTVGIGKPIEAIQMKFV